MLVQMTTILGCLVTGLSLLASMAHAATFYVSKSGSNGHSCSAAQSPWSAKQSIRDGMGCLASGDTLYVQAGTYAEKLRSGWVSGATYARDPQAPMGSVIIRDQDAGQPRADAPVYITGANNVVFDGFVVNGTDGIQASAVFAGLVVDNSGSSGKPQNVRVSNNEIIGCAGEYGVGTQFIRNRMHGCSGYGLYWSGRNGVIDGNEFYDFGGYCIHMYGDGGGVDHNIIRNNICRNSGFHSYDVRLQSFTTPGIIVASGTGNQVYNNVLANNHAGLQIWSSNTLVAYNSFYGNGNAYGAGAIIVGPFQSPTGTIIRNNLSWGNASNGISVQGGSVSETNNLWGVDPRWVNPGAGNLRLQAGSPAIDQGVTVSGVQTDADGAKRVAGMASDIGAYEFGSTGGGGGWGIPIGRLPKPTNVRLVVK